MDTSNSPRTNSNPVEFNLKVDVRVGTGDQQEFSVHCEKKGKL